MTFKHFIFIICCVMDSDHEVFGGKWIIVRSQSFAEGVADEEIPVWYEERFVTIIPVVSTPVLVPCTSTDKMFVLTASSYYWMNINFDVTSTNVCSVCSKSRRWSTSCVNISILEELYICTIM